MAAPKENRLFPPQPYYVPGYVGFVPQFKYRFGNTFGRTTYQLLTDPTVRKSPRSLLAPLPQQKFDEDSTRTQHYTQGYTPENPGYFTYDKDRAATSFPDPVLQPRSPAQGPGLAEEDLMMMDTDSKPWLHPREYIPRPRLPRGYIGGISRHPASEEKQEWRLPDITSASGQGRNEPSQFSGSWAGTRPRVKTEGVTLPGVAEITGVKHKWMPKLDVPTAIQQKVIPGYTGFIPRLRWIYGRNYNLGVKEAMEEFDEYQFLQRNPVCRLGKRYPRTHWPNNRIYTSAGLLPAYMGFVPHLRETSALTYGNSTRKAYEKEQRRRACAL